MKIVHCKLKFKPYDVWFLYDNSTNKKRRLLLGKCPICHKDIVVLSEERKSDNKVFNQVETGMNALRIIDNIINKNDVIETYKEIQNKKGRPVGLCYGINKEIHNNKGELIKIRQFRSDFIGTKEIIKEIQVK